jgi:uncharacterized peroxidase-related enzyme
MSEAPISFFPIAERQHCSAEMQALFADLEATLGFVPNVIRAFAWKEARFWKWWAHRNDIMAPSDGLSKAEREMIAVVVSAANDCLYCMTAHGFALRVLLKDPVTAERILMDYHRAGLPPRTLAMLDYAVKITRRPVECSLADVEGLRKHGFRDEDIWDIAEVAAMYNFTNRLASATGMLPNPEYHGLAREVRQTERRREREKRRVG